MSHENCSEEPEVQQEAHGGPEDRSNKDVKVKEFLKASQTEKRTISPLTLLKEDLSQFKEEVMKAFKDTNPRASQSGEKPINPLTLLKEDFNHFKEDLSSVFKIGLSKERDNKEVAAKEDSSNTSTARTSKPERAEEPFRSLFRGDRNPLKTSQSATKRAEQAENDFRKANKEMDNGEDGPEHGELDGNASEEKSQNTGTVRVRNRALNPT